MKMSDIVKELKEYFERTPRSEVLKDWEKSKELDEVGPTVEEYFDLDFEFDQAQTFFGGSSPSSGHLVRTKKGLMGWTLHRDSLVNGKVKVYTDSGNFLCRPESLKVIGFID